MKKLFSMSVKTSIFFTVALTALASALAQSSPPAPALVQPLTPYTIGAQRSGLTTCVPRINQVTSFLVAQQPNSGIVLTSPNRDANLTLSASIMEIQIEANASSFVSAIFTPKADGSCAATYDAISYWNGTCTQVANGSFATLKPSGPLLKQINMLDGGPTLKVFLMPIGPSGCLSIKKELIF